MDESIAEENGRKTAKRLLDVTHVYRQCNDSDCAAFILDLPHSHYERVSNTMRRLEEAKARWEILTHGQWEDVTPHVLPADIDESTQEWYSIPVADLMQKVGEYITWVETGMTKDVCKCTWIEHPDPSKGMIRGGDTALDCPAHSKEGLVLGFFTWLTGTQPKAIPDTAMGDG